MEGRGPEPQALRGLRALQQGPRPLFPSYIPAFCPQDFPWWTFSLQTVAQAGHLGALCCTPSLAPLGFLAGPSLVSRTASLLPSQHPSPFRAWPPPPSLFSPSPPECPLLGPRSCTSLSLRYVIDQKHFCSSRPAWWILYQQVNSGEMGILGTGTLGPFFFSP